MAVTPGKNILIDMTRQSPADESSRPFVKEGMKVRWGEGMGGNVRGRLDPLAFKSQGVLNWVEGAAR